MDLFNTFSTAAPFAYAALFPVLNPIGAAFIFFALTSQFSPAVRAQLSRKIALNTFYLLLAVFFVGGWVMRFFGITIPVVQVAGGLIVAHIGWAMMSQKPTPPTPTAMLDEAEANRQAFFPLTMPLTAGPGCIAVALTLGDTPQSTWTLALSARLGDITGIFLAAVSVYFCYRYSEYLIQKVGENGANVINKLTAFLYMCIGVTILWRGISQLGLDLSETIIRHANMVTATS